MLLRIVKGLLILLVWLSRASHGRRLHIWRQWDQQSSNRKRQIPVDLDPRLQAISEIPLRSPSTGLSALLFSLSSVPRRRTPNKLSFRGGELGHRSASELSLPRMMSAEDSARSEHDASHTQGRVRNRDAKSESIESHTLPYIPSRRMLLGAAAAYFLADQALAYDESRPFGFEPLAEIDVAGATLNEVEATFTPEFSAFLARFLINNEQETRRWWKKQKLSAQSIENFPGMAERFELSQFSSLITSVEVGLEKFKTASDVAKLAASLQRRYKTRTQKRQLAQLFSLLDDPSLQPVVTIKSLLGEADNARVTGVSLDGDDDVPFWKGWRPTYSFATRDVKVNITSPPTNGRAAKVKPVLRASGRWSVVRLRDGGQGYADDETPEVSIIWRTPNSSNEEIRPAVVRATTREGKVDALILEDSGGGYFRTDNATFRGELRIAPPADRSLQTRAARGALLPEYVLVGFEILDGGAGYNADEPPEVVLTERLNVSGLSDFKPRKYKFQVSTLVRATDLKGANETNTPYSLQEVQRQLSDSSRMGGLTLPPEAPALPPALVPKLDERTGTYRLPIRIPSGAFGQRGSVPVEIKPSLKLSQIAKLFLSGALCSGTAHTLLVPIDVVKTALQQDDSYTGPIDCAKDLIAKEGPQSLLRGAGATAVGYAAAGAVSFGLVEVLSRALRGAAGPGIAQSFGTPLLTLAAAMATAACTLVLCPFEAVRVQTVKTGKNSSEVVQEILATEGIGGFYRGIAPILLKDVPFVVAKFVVFDFLAEMLMQLAVDNGLAAMPGFEALIPLVAGSLAGLAAVIVSQPADVVFTLASDTSLESAIAEVQGKPLLIGNGLSPRLIFGALLVSMQFFFFTQLRSFLGISNDDLTLVWDALALLRN